MHQTPARKPRFNLQYYNMQIILLLIKQPISLIKLGNKISRAESIRERDSSCNKFAIKGKYKDNGRN